MHGFLRKIDKALRRTRTFVRTRPHAVREIVGVVVFFFVSYAVLYQIDAFERFYEFSRAHDSWQLDELFVAIIPAFCIAVGYGVRRRIDMRKANRKLRASFKKIEALYQEQAALRIEAERANRAKSDFLANMSHELRTPLNAIIGYAEIVAEDIADGRAEISSEEDLERVVAAARHLLALINDLLDLSKIESGRVDLHIESIDAADMIREVAAMSAPLAAKSNAHLVWQDQTDLGVIYSDRQRIQQCLLNYISNACKFAPNGEVRINAKRLASQTGEMLHVSVEDNGAGMSQEQLEHMFQPFQQADSSIAAQFGGTGLGLSITRELAALLGGHAYLESEPGVGACATLIIPVDLASIRQAALENEPSLETRPASRLPAAASV